MQSWKPAVTVLASLVLGLSLWVSHRTASCQNAGGRLDLPWFRCKPAIPILIERDLKRS